MRSAPFGRVVLLLSSVVLLAAGCAHYNTYYNAARAFRQGEREREDAVKAGRDVSQPTANQKKSYERAIQKAQLVLDQYPGSGLTDDALFLMAKSYHRLGSYRMSIGKLELLFVNFPKTPFEEEALYLQALNHLYIQDIVGSTAAIEQLQTKYPKSRYRAEAARVRADNAFALRQWEAARDYCRQYLEQYAEGADRDQVGLKLGQSLFELKDWAGAVQALRDVAAHAPKGETQFRARLLLARALAAQKEAAAADQEIALLKGEAETYGAQGEVALAECENLVAQGRDGETAPMLENIPADWRKDQGVNARTADLLGRVYYRQWKLEEANKQLRDALKNAQALPDPEDTRTLQANLRDYLAAEQGLKSVRGDSAIAYLKLAQANALLFGFERPRLALDLYREVAGTAGADSSTRARGLFGAGLVLRDRLGLPDSAAAYFATLERDFPRTPQAFVSRHGPEGDVFTFLHSEYETAQRRKGARAAQLAGAGSAGQTPAPAAPAAAAAPALPGASAVTPAGAVPAPAGSSTAAPSGAEAAAGAPAAAEALPDSERALAATPPSPTPGPATPAAAGAVAPDSLGSLEVPAPAAPDSVPPAAALPDSLGGRQ